MLKKKGSQVVSALNSLASSFNSIVEIGHTDASQSSSALSLGRIDEAITPTRDVSLRRVL